MSLANLKEQALKLNSQGGVPFMEGRSLGGKLPEGSSVSLDAFGYIKGDDGEYVVMSFQDYPDFFFFGGSVVTEKIRKLEAMMSDADIEAMKVEGIPVSFLRKKNKTGKKEYTTCTFWPEAEAVV